MTPKEEEEREAWLVEQLAKAPKTISPARAERLSRLLWPKEAAEMTAQRAKEL